MNGRTLFLHIALGTFLLIGNSCQQSSNQTGKQTDQTSNQPVETIDGTIISNAVSHPEQDIPAILVTENFEKATTSKLSYAASEVTFDSGQWLLDDALLGGSKDDAKNGDHAVRIRKNGKLVMQFDVDGAAGITIIYGAYGTDGPSSWQLWASKDGGKTFLQLDETVTTTTHELKQASFHVNADQAVRFEIRKISGGKNRLNIDDVMISTGGGKAISHTGGRTIVTKAVAVHAGTTHRGPACNEDNSHLLLGNPSAAVSSTGLADNYLIDQKYYTESYNRTKGGPNWVSWHIGAEDLGSTDRLNNFRPDTGLPDGWYEADNTSYKGSGFDKGHNCPSGDRTSSTEANSATFLMDNMIPQAPNNNQHTWEHLESYCRDQVKKGNEVYVVMGNYGTGGTGKNGYFTSIAQGKINVPAHIWKVVVIIPNGNNDLQRINSQTRVIAIDTPNDNSVTPNWMNYLCTVRDIEKATGYDLLSALPESVQDDVENKRFKGGD